MISKIKLQNWKSHAETELSFTKGINVLIGPMGSGKSSVLQGICYALFGFLPETKRRELKTAELIKRNSGPLATIELEWVENDKKFIISRVLGQNKSEATVRDADGVLLAGTNPSQVNAFLKTHINLSEDVFLNTVYAKQNEIDLFLQLTPQERKSRLDELMSLNKYETARKSCVRLINLLSVKKEEKEAFLKSINLEKIKQELYFLEQEILKLREEKESAEKELAEKQMEKQKAETSLRALRSELELYERLSAEQNILISQINEINLKLAGKQPLPKEELTKNLESLQAELEDLESQKFSCNKNLNDCLNKSISLEKELGFVESKLADTELRLEQISIAESELDSLNKKLGVKDIGEELEKARAEIKRLDLELASIESEIKLNKKHINELKGVEGVCPVCLRALEEHTKEQLLNAKEEAIQKLLNTLELTKKEKENFDNKYNELSLALDQSKELIREIAKKDELTKQKSELSQRLETLRHNKSELSKQKEDLENQLKTLEQKISELKDKSSTLKEELYLAELQTKKEQNLKRLDEIKLKLAQRPSQEHIENVETEHKALVAKCEELKSKANSLDYVIEEKNKRLADLKSQEENAAKLEQDLSKLQRKMEFLQQLRSALLLTQEQLRKELLGAVNELMEKIWSLLYPYEKWNSLRLNASETDYSLELRTFDNIWLPVIGFASGGERMLAALAVRLAFAKILSPEFNILILDEPTHNLDSAAIETFISALQGELSEFLEQLFIVTHEERLAEVGDNVIKLG